MATTTIMKDVAAHIEMEYGIHLHIMDCCVTTSTSRQDCHVVVDWSYMRASQ
jgi:hypothetical protein